MKNLSLSAYLNNGLSALRRVVVSALCASVLFGCSSVTAPVAPEAVDLSEPQALEKRLFKVVSDFYCAEYRWPSSWGELDQFLAGRGEGGEYLAEVSDAKIASPRAIVMTVDYTAKDTAQPRKVTFIAPPSCATSSDKELVSIAGGGVVFRLPDGFVLMKGAEVKARWKAPPYPDVAWSAADGGIIAIRFGEEGVKPSEVSDLGADLADAYRAAVPGLVWRSQDLSMAGSVPVVSSEFESDSSLGRIVNIVLSSSYDQRLFAITVTGPAEQAERIRSVGQAVRDTLVIR